MELQQLEQQIGWMPGDDRLSISHGNRTALKQWLIASGIAPERVDAMRDGTLYKAYAKPAYLRAILSRGDYVKPGEAKPIVHNPAEIIEGEAIVLEPAQKAIAAPQITGSKAQQLASLLSELVPGNLDEDRVIALIKQHAPKPDDRIIERIVIVAGEERIALEDEHRHKAFPSILAMVKANIPVMLVGPAGAGKTTLGHQVAKACELSFSHTGAVSSRFELSGFRDAHGNYQATALRTAYEFGGVFLFDEIDGSDPAALLWCNTAIANGVCAFPDGNVERHPDFRLIACANTYGRGADRVYVGRNPLDGASLDRFVVVDFDYDEQLERAVFGDNDWTQRVQSVRAAVERLKLRHVVSPRATDYGKRLIAAGMDRKAVEAATLWKGLERDQIAKINGECH